MRTPNELPQHGIFLSGAIRLGGSTLLFDCIGSPSFPPFGLVTDLDLGQSFCRFDNLPDSGHCLLFCFGIHVVDYRKILRKEVDGGVESLFPMRFPRDFWNYTKMMGSRLGSRIPVSRVGFLL